MVKLPFSYLFKPTICLNTLKESGTEKSGGETKTLKKATCWVNACVP